MLRFPEENHLLISFFCTTWQEILAQVLLHKSSMMGQTLQTVTHGHYSLLEVGTVERQNHFALNTAHGTQLTSKMHLK